MNFEDLSPHVLSLIFQKLTLKQIDHLCTLHLKLDQKICLNDDFWKTKYLQEFSLPLTTVLDWKKAYIDESRKIIPRNYYEAWENISRISPARSGRRNESYNISELRQIAKNLGIRANGSKNELARRIIDQIRQYFRSM